MLQNKAKTIIRKLAILLLWVGVWQGIFLLVNQELLVASPMAVLKRLEALVVTEAFWLSILYSFLRIIIGYVIGVAVGVIFAALSSASAFIKELLSPVISFARATPVASFIILALVWIKKDIVPVFIVFLIVFPVIYSNVIKAIEKTPAEYLESAKIYRFSFFKTVRTVYFYSVLPSFTSACISSLGLAWKSGVAAEVLAMPLMSVGYNLYRSKINIETADLFAWTTVVVLLSVAVEKIISRFLKEKVKGENDEKTDS